MTDKREPTMSAKEESWLKEILADSYLDDAGFTDRLLSELPPRRQRASRRTVILAVSTALAGWLGLVVWSRGETGCGARWLNSLGSRVRASRRHCP